MKNMRTAREAALQVLFQREFQQSGSPTELFYSFADNFSFDDQTRDYALVLTDGVVQNEEEINQTIKDSSENWKFERIALLDRILLQIAIFELKYSTETPTAPKLCIFDILDLAKKYSSQESKNFINGILDKVYQEQAAD